MNLSLQIAPKRRAIHAKSDNVVVIPAKKKREPDVRVTAAKRY
jgi:hypothetical protein